MSMNYINQKIKENPGKPILGLYIMSKDPTLIEFAALAGYDFIRIDYEHIFNLNGKADFLVPGLKILLP